MKFKFFFILGMIGIRCEASILTIYRRSRSEDIYVKTHSAENLATPQHEYSSRASVLNCTKLGVFEIFLTLLAIVIIHVA